MSRSSGVSPLSRFVIAAAVAGIALLVRMALSRYLGPPHILFTRQPCSVGSGRASSLGIDLDRPASGGRRPLSPRVERDLESRPVAWLLVASSRCAAGGAATRNVNTARARPESG